MKRIWKSGIAVNSMQDSQFKVKFRAPEGCKVLSVHLMDGSAFVWYECDEEAPITDCYLYSVGTGHGSVPALEPCHFLTTLVMGAYVWHIYVPEKFLV